MKESYSKGIASHTGLESCLDDPRGRGEALTEEIAGGLLSFENALFPGADPVGSTRRQHVLPRQIASGNMTRRSRRTWHARTFYARESGCLGRSLLCPETGSAETTGKVKDYKPVVKSTEKSDSVIVVKRLSNKEGLNSAETMERRTLTKRNSNKEAVYRIQSRANTSIGLVRVRQRGFDAITRGRSRMK